MSYLQRVLSKLRGTPAAERTGEDDAQVDRAMATSRETGGADAEHAPDTMDKNSTTGTTESGEFVGRAGSDETGDVGLSGAEARGDEADGATGAARPG
ncbi:hypothetical protein GCM10023340_06780 [Nocardioides marinquilinus]|uniref:Uncharacterized protein n=1 Tax=Nocardioides marinquilinus TaxID=1210400 RepID=A0ABP9PE14_9ACTN